MKRKLKIVQDEKGKSHIIIETGADFDLLDPLDKIIVNKELDDLTSNLIVELNAEDVNENLSCRLVQLIEYLALNNPLSQIKRSAVAT